MSRVYGCDGSLQASCNQQIRPKLTECAYPYAGNRHAIIQVHSEFVLGEPARSLWE